MNKKIINFIFFLISLSILLFFVHFGLKVGIYKDGDLKYYKKINKTEKQVKYSKLTDIGVSILQYSPVIVATFSKNPIMITTYAGSMLFSTPICFILKQIVREKRPDDPNNFKSFPSGHTTLSFIGATTLLVSLKKIKNKIIFGSLSFFIAILVAYGRILARRHWIVDVVFGSLLGIIVTFLCYKVTIKLMSKYKNIILKKIKLIKLLDNNVLYKIK